MSGDYTQGCVIRQRADLCSVSLKQVVVTELMVKAAMDYVLGLWDRDVDIFLLEDVFRIMAVLQPRPLDIPKLTSAPSQ